MSSVTVAAIPKRTDPSSTKESRPVVLLVDDDEAVRSILSRTLTHFGYVVVECDSGEAAMLAIQREDIAFDVVLCDTFLGGMNGDETARLIRPFSTRSTTRSPRCMGVSICCPTRWRTNPPPRRWRA